MQAGENGIHDRMRDREGQERSKTAWEVHRGPEHLRVLGHACLRGVRRGRERGCPGQQWRPKVGTARDSN
eukprot:1160178-Pelagomonas_calceolata.AAC.13